MKDHLDVYDVLSLDVVTAGDVHRSNDLLLFRGAVLAKTVEASSMHWNKDWAVNVEYAEDGVALFNVT